jgi:hypothetical protein
VSDITLCSAYFESCDGHDHHLVETVHIANRLARMAGEETRDLLYEQKATLLCRAVELMPGDFAFSDFDERGFIGLRHTPSSYGFHLPAAKLTPGARTAVVESLTRFLSSPQQLRRVA